ncbi:MAG: SsrA-binding protein SmpB, partial [Vampirovibrionia bacterium]
MSKAKKENKNTSSVVASNKKAFHEYHILERYDAGIVLTGTEIKSVRERRVSFADSYVKIEKGEVWLINTHIALYEQGNRYNHEIARKRKLLLTKVEIRKLTAKV